MASKQDSSSSSYNESRPSLPLHLCFFLITLLVFLSMSWYLSEDSVIGSLVDSVKLLLIVSPVLLLLAVHLLSGFGVPFLIPFPERDSPWGLALVLVLLLSMVSFKSYFSDGWFPLLGR